MSLAIIAVCAVAGLILFVKFLTAQTDPDAAMRFNPLGKRPQSPWFIAFHHRCRQRRRQLTYRRDRHGRFRDHDR